MNIYGLEMIANQSDDMCSKVTKLIDGVRTDNNQSTYTFSELLSELLTKRFGLTIVIDVVLDESINFWTYENTFVKDCVIGRLSTSKLTGKKDIITAEIDLNKAYISGSIQKYPFYVCLTAGALLGRNTNNEYTLTSEGVAAAILHEVGHCFNYVEYMVNTSEMAAVIKSRTDDLIDKDTNIRLRLVNNIKEFKEFSKQDKEDIANATKRESIEVIILKNLVEKKNKYLGMEYYCARTSEQAADMFAIRNGAGKGIADTFKVFFKRESTFERWSGEILTTLVTCGLPIIVVTLFFNWTLKGDLYDSDEYRCTLAKRELINRLKTAKTQQEKSKLLETIDVYDRILKVCKNPPKGLFYYAQYLTSSNFRKAVKETKSIKEIEGLIDNDLYVLSNKLTGKI